jgi:hypothetical protein
MVLKTIVKAVIATVCTDKFLKELSVHILKSLSKSTDSKLDDEFVLAFHKALIPSDFEPKASEAPSGEQAAKPESKS